VQEIIASWERQSPAIRVLRAFLGMTFLYAGWVKASDPKYFASGFVESVSAAARTTPISQLVEWVTLSPNLFAWAVIVTELAVGLFTLLGVAAFATALVGAFLTLILWPSSNWVVPDHFLAAAPAYLILWLVYALTLRERRSGPRVRAATDRRGFLRGALSVLTVAGLTVIGRFISRPDQATPSAEERVGPMLSEIAIGEGATFESSGGLTMAIRTGENEVVAYALTCTHQGCTVEYDSGWGLFMCPCHGATFDPKSNGKATAPASRPLRRINVRINEAGQIVEG
jgi:thiosulfate dehydrogenase [quinone] large subunit